MIDPTPTEPVPKTRPELLEDFWKQMEPHSRWKRAASIARRRANWIADGPRILNLVPPILAFAAVICVLWRGLYLEGLGVIAAVAALSIGMRSALSKGAIIEPIVLPKAVAELGWTGELVAARILDAAGRFAHDKTRQPKPILLPPSDPLPKIEVPGFKLSPSAFGDLLRELVGARRRRLSGEIMSGSPDYLTLRIRGLPGGYESVGPVQQGDLEELFEKAGELLLDKLAPYNLAYSLYSREDYAKALDVAGRGADNESLQRNERAQCEILRWLLLRRKAAAVEEILKAVTRAADYDQTHPMVVMAVTEQMNDAAKQLNRKSEFWDRMSDAAGRWAWTPGVPNRMEIVKSGSAGRTVQLQREFARGKLDDGRGYLRAALKTRRKLDNALLNPATSLRVIDESATELDRWLREASTALKIARANDPEIIDTIPFVKLEGRVKKLKVWRDAQTDPRLSQGRAEAVKLYKTLQAFGKDLDHHDKRWKETRRNFDAGFAKKNVIQAWKDALECWPRRQPLKSGYLLANLIGKLERNDQDNERLAANMRLLPRSGQLMLRYAIRNNARLDAWVAKRLSQSEDAKVALREYLEGEALLDKWIAEREADSTRTDSLETSGQNVDPCS
jgi:hypothetical protein